ncbi:MAG: 6-carboxytetrahydropterin synthase [Atopobiaceae bacterium]|jgi:6-pyruvoyltetrahydropterin/6-carboxytetrahydropterin synthase|nr:6-carboxytetrahydropterin synthase [Atopobiaceae bacterium]MCH4119614.1 6-carboxytetrahydropterin synthase [Atopobiaceae bacterium]MCI1318214.1 6-carboxytetrahydropterin synthase [Atopobiaceae bacterium]MCI1388685.1 6-carboxytetrahydropterin synthase [Atopobiaceae bacterium]MCI1432695.1 6-carboxytetrahydropterin synthase [Atopobiaceae bacterium]
MARRLVREWGLKFYLNSYHYITIKGNKGETHPHTWELTVRFRVSDSAFVPYYEFEKDIQAFIEPFNGALLNETDTFRDVLPTLEGVVETFLPEFDRIISDAGGELLSVSGSESPTRMYTVHVVDDDLVAGGDSGDGRDGGDDGNGGNGDGPADDEHLVDELINEALQ